MRGMLQQQCNSCLGCSGTYSVSNSKRDVATIVQPLSWLQWDIQHHVLLTGTPIQNNLGELYALLAFIDRKQFKPSRLDSFVEKYTNSSKDCKLQKPTWRQIGIYVCAFTVMHISMHTFKNR